MFSFKRKPIGNNYFSYFCTRKGIDLIITAILYLIRYNIIIFNDFIPESI